MNLSIAWYRPSPQLQRGQFWLSSTLYIYVTITQTFDGWVWESETFGGNPIARSTKPLVTRKKAEGDLAAWAERYREAQQQYVGKGGEQ